MLFSFYLGPGYNAIQRRLGRMPSPQEEMAKKEKALAAAIAVSALLAEDESDKA
jgi:hypothetical protein